MSRLLLIWKFTVKSEGRENGTLEYTSSGLGNSYRIEKKPNFQHSLELNGVRITSGTLEDLLETAESIYKALSKSQSL